MNFKPYTIVPSTPVKVPANFTPITVVPAK